MASMPTHVALLRGINVGGKNKVAMADLRALVADLGHTDVSTYIQSGNVLFSTAGTDTAKLAATLEAARVLLAADRDKAAAAYLEQIDAAISADLATPRILASLQEALRDADISTEGLRSEGAHV